MNGEPDMDNASPDGHYRDSPGGHMDGMDQDGMGDYGSKYKTVIYH
jgi:hypothetical protein